MTRTREEYLQAVIEEFRRDYKRVGIKVPRAYASVGHVGNGRTIGATYSSWHSPDRVNQMFIAPEICETDELIKVVAHEVVHVILDCQHGHTRNFVLLARQLGFTKPYTRITSTDVLDDRVKEIVAKLGKYPHPGFRYLDNKPTKCVAR